MTFDRDAFAARVRAVSDAAYRRGERIVGYHGDADGGYFRFDFGPIPKVREQRTAPEASRKVSRGAIRQGSLL